MFSEKSVGKENFIFSPYSIHKAFSIAMLASKGSTRKELEKALSLRGDNKDIVDEYEWIAQVFKYICYSYLQNFSKEAHSTV